MTERPTVAVHGITRYRAFSGRVTEQLAATLAGLRARPISIRAAFADDSGPRGGVAARCGLTVQLPHRPPLHVEHTAETPRRAFDGALLALERGIERDRQRARDSRRRPKKYYAAKRLLGTDGVAAPRARRQP